uniref:PKD domain-containing protein n=1 Tax=candidate division WOR-3 bacterium TaxID=2052148 RepID=A0A7C4CCM9_UNCW3
MSNRLWLLALLAAGCGNVPPSRPIVSGPDKGRPNDTLVFTLFSVDRDGDTISYYCEWSAGMDSGWTGWTKEGEELAVRAWFADSGRYWLRVKARDTKHETGWTDTTWVSIRDYGPLVPPVPAGPDTTVVGAVVSFLSSAVHPLGEAVALQFRWNDSLEAWTGFNASGATVVVKHAFPAGGVWEVRCRASDRGGRLSDWSGPKTVVVIDSFGRPR